MEGLILDGLRKVYDTIQAISEMSASVDESQILALVGPSGCGKSTTLRCIAGLERLDKGRVVIDGTVMTDADGGVFVPPERRGLGMVFQSYAIWPHMTVFENVAFPLRIRGWQRSNIRRRIDEVLTLVDLAGFSSRLATQLSGGQQQRVALARALSYEPKLLLLDEPLSNLDVQLRQIMRFEIRDLQRKTGVTMVYVTHDLSEAFVIADRIAVMNHGRVEQAGKPDEIYDEPRSLFVARFVGRTNFLRGVVQSLPQHEGDVGLVRIESSAGPLKLRGKLIGNPALGADVTVVLRAEDFELLPVKDRKDNENSILGTVNDVYFLGDFAEVRVDGENGSFHLTCRFLRSQVPTPGSTVCLRIRPESIRCFPEVE